MSQRRYQNMKSKSAKSRTTKRNGSAGNFMSGLLLETIGLVAFFSVFFSYSQTAKDYQHRQEQPLAVVAPENKSGEFETYLTGVFQSRFESK